MTVYLEVRGIDPSDLDTDMSRAPQNDQATAIANDVFSLLVEHHDLDISGVATVVNNDSHERLRDA